MSRMVGAAVKDFRLALAVILGGTGVFLLLSLLTTTPSAPSAVALGAVAATIAALARPDRLSMTPLSSPLRPPFGSSDEVPALCTGHVTDSPRHPLRPRAPGLV